MSDYRDYQNVLRVTCRNSKERFEQKKTSMNAFLENKYSHPLPVCRGSYPLVFMQETKRLNTDSISIEILERTSSVEICWDLCIRSRLSVKFIEGKRLGSCLTCRLLIQLASAGTVLFSIGAGARGIRDRSWPAMGIS
jgi:hypothetical protein